MLVTGGSGFLGHHILRALKDAGCGEIHAPRSAEYDLRRLDDVRAVLQYTKPTIVLHLAARVGGIGANRANPGTFFYDNALMGIHMMEESRLAGVRKFVGLGTICAYPKHAPVPFREDDLWNGYPEETNAPYGLAKKMLLVQGQAYRAQYGFNAIHLLPVNLYGPGDHFDLENSHVIPAMIRKFIEASQRGDPAVVLWGTGDPTREFLYVADAARAIVLATELYDSPEPVNVGSGMEVTIRELANTIRDLVGYSGRITWDTSKPDGQPRRRLATERAARAFGFRASTDFHTGLRETIAWYRAALTKRPAAPVR